MTHPLILLCFSASILASQLLPAQEVPQTIFSLYNISPEGCPLDENIPDKMLSGAGLGAPGFQPEAISGAEDPESYFVKYQEYLATTDDLPAPTRKLKNGNELFSDGKLWGLRDPGGRTILEPQFLHVEQDDEGFVAYTDGTCRYYNGSNGKPVLSQPFLHVERWGAAEFLVRTAGGFGLVLNDQTVIEPKHKSIFRSSSKNRAYYTIGNQYVLLDDFSTIIANPGLTQNYLDQPYFQTSGNIINTKNKRKLFCDESAFNIELLHPELNLIGIQNKKDKAVYLTDPRGNLLTSQAFAGIQMFNSSGIGAAWISAPGNNNQNYLYGLIDTKGNWVIDPQFQSIFLDNGWWLAQTHEGPVKLFQPDGKPAPNRKGAIDKYNTIKLFSPEFALCTVQTGEKSETDIVNLHSGKVLQKMAPYQSIVTVNPQNGPCGKPRYIAKSNESEQILDESFKPITPVHKRFFYAGNYFEGANFPEGGKIISYYNCSGKPIQVEINGKKEEAFLGIKLPNDSITYIQLPDGKPYWVSAHNGAFQMESPLADITPFGVPGLYLVTSPYPPKIGVVNEKGQSVLPMQFRQLSAGNRETGVVRFETLHGNAGLLDNQGKIVNNTLYSEIKYLKFNLYLVGINSRFGVINERGEEILPVKFEKIYWNKGVFSASEQGKTFLYDITGKPLK